MKRIQAILAAIAAIAAAVVHITQTIKLELDKIGKKSESSVPTLGLLVILSTVLFLPSCSAVSSAITGQPIPATAVQRAGQPQAAIIHISSVDLASAEFATENAILAGDAPPIHGLYDAGYLAARARETVIESTK